MGSYTTNLNLYKPAVGEQGWGTLVNNNFETLDTPWTTANIIFDNSSEITSMDIPQPYGVNTVGHAVFFPNGTNITQTMTDTYIKPAQSLRYLILYCGGSLTIDSDVTITTYPTTLISELPPSTPETNTTKIPQYNSQTISSNISYNNTNITISLNSAILNTLFNNYITIPHATVEQNVAGTATNTCNGGGGAGADTLTRYGGVGCIFGQYPGGIAGQSGYGYGATVPGNKYCSALIIYVAENLTINGTIDLHGGDYVKSYNIYSNGGYGGGAGSAGGGSNNGCGGGGAPVFIYYGGTYTNNGTINTAGGIGFRHGGAGGIKVTRIT